MGAALTQDSKPECIEERDGDNLGGFDTCHKDAKRSLRSYLVGESLLPVD